MPRIRRRFSRRHNTDEEPDKYIIFLKHSYFKKSCFRPVKNKLVGKLENRGVTVKPFFDSGYRKLFLQSNKCSCCRKKRYYRGMINTDFSMRDRDNNTRWDDNETPEANVLYIWLTNGRYYSDKIYPEKKTELEREVLLIIAGLLGAKTVDWQIKLHTNDILLVNESAKGGVVEQEVNYETKNEASKDTSITEEYDNTGAELIIKAPEWGDFKNQLDEKLRLIDRYTKKGIYQYFINNSNLLMFAYKRSRLKLKKYNYTIKQEKISEKSIQIRNVLHKYNLCGKIKTTHSKSKLHTYTIDFYPLRDILNTYEKKIEYDQGKIESDPFYKLRVEYEKENLQKLANNPEWIGDVEPMYRACKEYASQKGFHDELDQWINNREPGSFHHECHSFKDVKNVDKWFDNNLIPIREENKKKEEEKEVERTPTRAPRLSLRSMRSFSKRNIELTDGKDTPLDTVQEDVEPEPEPEPNHISV